MKTHRDLHPLPLDEALAYFLRKRTGAVVVTMAEGQWDGLLSAAYDNGWVLLELDKDEVPVRAYRKARN